MAEIFLLTWKRHPLQPLQEPDLAKMKEAVANDDALNLAANREPRVIWVQWTVQVVIGHVRQALLDCYSDGLHIANK